MTDNSNDNSEVILTRIPVLPPTLNKKKLVLNYTYIIQDNSGSLLPEGMGASYIKPAGLGDRWVKVLEDYFG